MMVSVKAVLRQGKYCQHASITEIAENLMHLHNEETLIRHGIEIAGQTIDKNYFNAGFYRLTQVGGKLTR